MNRFINRVDGADEASIAALKKQNAELVSVFRELVYGGGGRVWTRARELLAKLDHPAPDMRDSPHGGGE